MTTIYEEMSKNPIAKRDRNNCAVITTAIAFGVDYSIAYQALKQLGRLDNHGVRYGYLIPILAKQFQQKVSEVEYPKQPNHSYYTLKTIAKRYPKGTVILFVKGHVCTMIDGVIHDWARGSKRRVKSVVRILDDNETTPSGTTKAAKGQQMFNNNPNILRKDFIQSLIDTPVI